MTDKLTSADIDPAYIVATIADPPRTDARCWPHPCRDYHETYAHISGEDPCACPCHFPPSATELRANAQA